jgi:hypothetical protein
MTDKQIAALLKSCRADLRKTREGYVSHPDGPHWRVAMPKLAQAIKELERPAVPALGPVLEDGLDMLLMAPTHNTDGVPHYPAFDTGFGQAGRWVLAPEALTVTRQSGAVGGDAVYATGASRIDYWIGHIAPAPATGRTFRKGERISRIADQSGTDHVHWGLDARALIGKDLLYGRNGDGPDYTWGAPTIGAQLATGIARGSV